MAYEPQFNAYVVSDEEVNQVIAKGKVPVILFPWNEALKLGLNDEENAPTIGFLLGREKGHYSIDYNYAKAICMAGGRIKGLTYTQVEEQMAEIDGLVLPGGSFVLRTNSTQPVLTIWKSRVFVLRLILKLSAWLKKTQFLSWVSAPALRWWLVFMV